MSVESIIKRLNFYTATMSNGGVGPQTMRQTMTKYLKKGVF